MLFIVADVMRYPRFNLYIQTIYIYTDIIKRGSRGAAHAAKSLRWRV